MAETVQEDREPVRHNVNAWFFKETALDDLLADAQPLRAIDDLAIEDLTGEEAGSFLCAIKE